MHFQQICHTAQLQCRFQSTSTHCTCLLACVHCQYHMTTVQCDISALSVLHEQSTASAQDDSPLCLSYVQTLRYVPHMYTQSVMYYTPTSSLSCRYVLLYTPFVISSSSTHCSLFSPPLHTVRYCFLFYTPFVFPSFFLLIYTPFVMSSTSIHSLIFPPPLNTVRDVLLIIYTSFVMSSSSTHRSLCPSHLCTVRYFLLVCAPFVLSSSYTYISLFLPPLHTVRNFFLLHTVYLFPSPPLHTVRYVLSRLRTIRYFILIIYTPFEPFVMSSS